LNAIQALSQLSYTPTGFLFGTGNIITDNWKLVNGFFSNF